jgi:hypothetical protein
VREKRADKEGEEKKKGPWNANVPPIHEREDSSGNLKYEIIDEGEELAKFFAKAEAKQDKGSGSSSEWILFFSLF